jgi:signal transduction histidine kinase
VWIVLEHESGGLGVQIVDDGSGFYPETEHEGHFGTEIMRERAESIGGSLRITSTPGQGTRVSVWVPAGEEQARLERAPS